MNHDLLKCWIDFTDEERQILNGVASPVSDRVAASLFQIATKKMADCEDELALLTYGSTADSARQQLDPVLLHSTYNTARLLAQQLAQVSSIVALRESSL